MKDSPAGLAPGTDAGLVDSHYEATVERKPFGPPLDGGLDTDVCVVGGGFTGISAALNLAEQGRKVVVLEAAKVGWGASGRNGGQCSVGFSRDNANRIAREIGAAATARELWDLSVEAVRTVRDRIRRHTIDCDFRDGHILAAVKGGMSRSSSGTTRPRRGTSASSPSTSTGAASARPSAASVTWPASSTPSPGTSIP